MKIGLLFFVFTLIIRVSLLAQDGLLDSSFSDDGITTTDFGVNEYGEGVAVRPDGKIIVAGYTQFNDLRSFALAQYNVNGTLDTSFGTGGLVITDLQVQAIAWALEIQPDGKIVVCGGGYLHFYLVRYNTDGTLDSSFGTDGIAYTEAGDYDAALTSLTIQPDGKIVAVGYEGNTLGNVYYYIVLIRYNSDGTLDDITYANVDTTMNAFDQAFSVVLQPDSKILVAANSLSMDVMAVIRFNADLTLDNSFGENGKVRISHAWAQSIAVQKDQKIVVAGGLAQQVWSDTVFIARLNVDGVLDNSFGDGGIVTTSIGASSKAVAVEIMESEKIQIGGNSENGFALIRYNLDGGLDSTFGNNGSVTTDIGDYSGANSMAIQVGGNIVLAGSTWNGSNDDFAVVRYLGSLNVGIIDLSSPTNSVLIYPNPIEKIVTLKYTLKTPETISIRLLDVQGKILKTFTEAESQTAGEHQQQISCPDQLPSGFYFLTISSANGNRVSVKIVK